MRVTVDCAGCASSGWLELNAEIGNGVISQQSVAFSGQSVTLTSVPQGKFLIQVLPSGASAVKPVQKVIEVGAADITVHLDANEGSIVSGRLVSDRGGPPPKGTLLRLTNVDALWSYTRAPDAEGRFTFPAVPHGSYGWLVTAPPDLYVRSALIGERDARSLSVGEGKVDGILITAAQGFGAVSGFVYDGEKSSPGVMAALVPEGLSGEFDMYHGYRTDSDGSFHWKNVRPGAYRLFAVESPGFEYAEPEVVRPYLKEAGLINLAPHDSFRERVQIVHH